MTVGTAQPGGQSFRLYKRVARVSIVKPTLTTGAWFQTLPNAIVIEDLRVQFQIERAISKQPNTCQVTISNLAPQTRTEVEAKPQIVIVEAGYDGNLKKLFAGDLRYGLSTRDGPDWNTVLQLGDADRAYRFSRVNRSYPAGTSYQTIATDCAAAMSAKIPDDMTSVLAAKQAVNGYTLHGPAHAEMTRLMQPFGREWSFQDGQFQALQDGVPRLDNRSAFLISQDTGMIGSPEFGAPQRPGKRPLLRVRTLLYAGIMPGHQVQVSSRAINGLFRAEKVRHTGDTHGADWMTELELTQL